MRNRQEIRSEETKQAVLIAAGRLFAERGYDSVTMREIARAAGCSHTTIYLYFKDKEALLHQLSVGPLESLQREMETILHKTDHPPERRLIEISRSFIHFCLTNRTMYRVFFMAQADRVDLADPAFALNRTRNHLFDLLRQAIGACLPSGLNEERVLAYARIIFYTVHGILATYTESPEPLEQLLGRLAPTFDLAIAVMIAGAKQTAAAGGEYL